MTEAAESRKLSLVGIIAFSKQRLDEDLINQMCSRYSFCFQFSWSQFLILLNEHLRSFAVANASWKLKTYIYKIHTERGVGSNLLAAIQDTSHALYASTKPAELVPMAS